MPVTGLYFCPDSGTTQPPAIAIADRLAKRYQPTNLGKWTLEHRLLREHVQQTPSSSSNASSSNHNNVTPGGGTPSGSYGKGQLSTITNQPRFMQYLDLSHHPGKRFCLVDKSIVTIDGEFELILTTKLQGIWAMRQTLKAEGTMFELDDFRVRIATLSQGSVMKGVLVEVEYLPCEYFEDGAPIISDFMERLELPSNPGVRMYIKPSIVEGNTGTRKKFTILDTGLQYMELLRLR